MRLFVRPAIAFFLALGVCACSTFAQNASHYYETLIQQGKAQLQAQHADQALAAGEQAIKLDAKNWEGYALTGGALMNLKRFDEAISQFSDAMERAPQDKQAGLSELRKQCFAAESGTPPPSTPPTPATNPSTPEATTTQAEIVLWKSIENSANPADFQAYLSQYPNGAFAALAERRMGDVKEKAETAAAAEKTEAEAAAWQRTGLQEAWPTQLNGQSAILLSSGVAITSKKAQKLTGMEIVDAGGKKLIFPLRGSTARADKGESADLRYPVSFDVYQGEHSLDFPVAYICHSVTGALSGMLVNEEAVECSTGKIYVTDQYVAYQSDKGKQEFLSKRSTTSIKNEGGRAGDTFSIYSDQGKRYRFGGTSFSPPFNSPFVMFLDMAVTDFTTAYKDAQSVVAKAQGAQNSANAPLAKGTE